MDAYRISTSQLYQSGLEGIYRNQAAMNEAIKEISSGLKSMTPVERAQAMSYEVNISNYGQYQKNAETVMPKLQTQEVAVRDIVENMQKFREMVISAKNANQFDKNLNTEDFNKLKDSILAAANIKDPYGNYVFSGYKGNTEPFPNLSVYNGDQGINQIRIGDSNFVDLNIPGNEIITSDISNAFNDFDSYLKSTSSVPGSILDNIDNGLKKLEINLVKLGGNMNKIENSVVFNDNVKGSDQERLSQLKDADITEAATKLSNAKNALEASLKTQVTIQNLSIFNYM